jgi:multiple sugar transport system permease protein
MMKLTSSTKGNFSFFDSNKKLVYFLVLPSLLIVFSVMLYPLLYALNVSFHKIEFATRTSTWMGISNYSQMFKDKLFLNSIRITGIFTFATVFLEIALGIAIALVLNQKFMFRGFVRGIMILPWALPGVVNGIMWKWIYNPNYGALNAMLSQLHIIDTYQVWMGKAFSALLAIIVADIWKETPYVVLLTIAALSNISAEIYEAARVDGAGPWKAFWKITLPLLKPVLLVLAITKTIWAIQSFDLVYIMTGGGPGSGTETITYYIYKTTFKFLQFGYGTAMAYFVSFITFALAFVYIKFLAREKELI